MMRNTRLLTLLLAISVLLPGAAIAVQTDAPTVDFLGGTGLVEKSDFGVYIVLMAEDPAIAYEGDTKGLGATKPERGTKIDPASQPTQEYREHLRATHRASLEAAGIRPGAKIHSYTIALNGYAAMMSHEQALAVASQNDVLAVKPDTMRFPHAAADLRSIAVDDAGSARLDNNCNEGDGATECGGGGSSNPNGKGVVVGVIDSGIWPEHPSFADDGSYEIPPITVGECDFGNIAHNPNDAPFTCNNKLIGARQMLDTYRAIIGADPDEYDSARDDNGHGTHTASTAAGNRGVKASMYGIRRGRVSGVAPRAHVVAYKGLGNLGGFTSDLAAAIDQAVADGVDVINYSVGGGAGLPGADEIAFLFAADAGVFVATSAGNAGPGPSTLGNPGTMPWMTTVGANTQRKFYQGTIVLGDASAYEGASITPGAAEASLVDAEFAGGDLCLPGTLDPTKVAGNIVLCRRGGSARTDKSRAVSMAGGVGTILYNNSDVDNLASDTHWTPTVHIDQTPGLAIKSYIATASSPTAMIHCCERGAWPWAPSMAYFSSRGPNPVSPDIIKPDVTAPGVQILAGNSPTPDPGDYPGELFQAIQGTSMSSPYVAGLFALIKQINPDWSAAMAKSAIMTTAHRRVVDNDRTSPADALDMGSGHARRFNRSKKGSIYQPGLAYDAGLFDYGAFTCGMDWGVFTPGSCDFLDSIGVPSDPSDLNLPSIGIDGLPGRQTVTRTVTSVAKENGWRRYRAYVKAPPGYEVTVSPSEFKLKKGETATYEVTITNVGAPIGEWRFGSLTWKDKTRHYKVSSPIAVRASLFYCPEELEGYGTTSGLSFDVKFGYTGSYAAASHGFAPAIVTHDNVLQDPDQSFDPLDGFSNAHVFAVSGAAYLRFSIPPDATETDADLDLYLYDPAGNQVARSSAGGTDEQIDILLPADGIWTLWVHGWSTPGGDSDYYLYAWDVPLASGGSLTIDSAPSAATLGATGTIDVSWFSLWDGTLADWHLGAVSHTGDVGLMCLTLIDVDLRFPTARPEAGIGPLN